MEMFSKSNVYWIEQRTFPNFYGFINFFSTKFKCHQNITIWWFADLTKQLKGLNILKVKA